MNGSQYRVKWSGFELDPLEWTNKKDVENCEALDDWKAAKKVLVVVDGLKEAHRHHVPKLDTGIKPANSEF